MSREHWDERYDAAESWNTEPSELLVAETEALPAGRALDLACGRGRNSVFLAGRGWRVTAADFSAVGLALARRFAHDRGVTVQFVQADVVEWEPPPESFDLVLVSYLHLPAEERRKVVAHAAAAVAPGGVVLVIAHDITNLGAGAGGPKDPAVLCGPEEVAAALSQLEVQRAELVERTVTLEDGSEAIAIDHLVRASRPL